jgi:hypothetical protein
MHQNDVFFIFKKLFLISAYQNDLKTPKIIKLKQKNKKKLIFSKILLKHKNKQDLSVLSFSSQRLPFHIWLHHLQW